VQAIERAKGTFGEQLREYRERIIATRAELAVMIGVSLETVRAWERNKRKPTHVHLLQLAVALELDPTERLRLQHPLYALEFPPTVLTPHMGGDTTEDS